MVTYVEMLGIDRRTLQVAWTLFLFVLTLFIVNKIGRTLIIFAVALIFAHLLSPVVDAVERLFPARFPRVASLAIVYFALLGALAAVLIPIGSRISEEAGALLVRLPDALQSDPLGHLPIPGWLEPFRPQVTAFVHQRLTEIGETIGPRLTEAGKTVISGIGSLLGVVLIPILAFFFLKDGRAIRDSIVASVAANRRQFVDGIFRDVHLLLAQYIRALVLLAMSTFTFYAVFLAIVGAPYPALLAGVAAVLEFIPAVGPLVGSVIIILVALATGYSHVLIIVLFLAVFRVFQDYVLTPYLMSSGIELHPLLILFGALAGEQLLGIPGMFFAVPAMAVLRLILRQLWSRHRAT